MRRGHARSAVCLGVGVASDIGRLDVFARSKDVDQSAPVAELGTFEVSAYGANGHSIGCRGRRVILDIFVIIASGHNGQHTLFISFFDCPIQGF